MAFELSRIFPWGRSLAEYRAMFGLTREDAAKHILGCGDGPASFNVELSRKGGRVISLDPLYKFRGREIRKLILETREEILDQTRKNKDQFVWKHFDSVEDLGRRRSNSMDWFLEHFTSWTGKSSYVAGSLPNLPFADDSFELALCSHLLFLYSDRIDEDRHVYSIKEMLRVAPEARVFPLLDLNAHPSRHVEPVRKRLEEAALQSEIVTVDYEFQLGGNQMMRVWREV